ncbi:MAG: Septum formation protein Maf [bacterium]|nr:Septum formation protein Maf [bacterium]
MGSLPSFILASASPRRRELLREAGIAFEGIPARVDESLSQGEAPLDYALRLAKEKAWQVAELHPGRWVLGADTIVVLTQDNGIERILGKPESKEEAARILSALSGKRHWVTTACALVMTQGESPHPVRIETFHVTSEVWFRKLSEAEIWAYVRTGEPMDKAGAYAIQGGAANFVEKFHGSWSNIVGLPMEELQAHLARVM